MVAPADEGVALTAKLIAWPAGAVVTEGVSVTSGCAGFGREAEMNVAVAVAMRVPLIGSRTSPVIVSLPKGALIARVRHCCPEAGTKPSKISTVELPATRSVRRTGKAPD